MQHTTDVRSYCNADVIIGRYIVWIDCGSVCLAVTTSQTAVLFKGTTYGNFSDRLQVHKTSNDLKQGCPVLLLEGHYLEQG